jgi:predicted nucleotidyltransferase
MDQLLMRVRLPMIYSQANPNRPQVRLARYATMRKVQDIIRRDYGTDYRVELFGSTSYGVDTPTSDLDLVILVRTCFHPLLALLNFDQDADRMDGFPPSLDLANLPGEGIAPSICPSTLTSFKRYLRCQVCHSWGTAYLRGLRRSSQ